MNKELHIAIVDDESIQIDSMKSLIKQAAKKMDISVEMIDFSSGEAFLFELEDYPNLDMVFLDIEMKQLDGLDVARKVREIDQELTIIFATAFAEYAVQGYEVQALDYLLKPIDVSQIEKVFRRQLEKQPLTKDVITLEIQGELTKLYQDDLIYIEVIKRECQLHLVTQILTVNKTLKELSDQLNDDFVQTHRSYLVNIAHIERLNKTDAELSNGESVPISRRLAKDIQEKFVEYNKRSVFYDD